MKITYERKKAIAQSKGIRELYERYKARERNRARNFRNKLSADLRMLFPNTIHVFEDLDKGDMVSRKRVERKRRKRNYITPWKRIHKRISGVALTASVDPSNTSRECPRCGYVVKTQEGQIFKCPKCKLKMNRHKVASINIRRRHLEGGKKRKTRMQRFPHSNEPETSMKVELWAGVTPSELSPVTWIPMKRDPEGRKPREEGLVNTKPNETRTPHNR